MASKDERIRTSDVAVDGTVTFDSLFLSDALKKGLEEMGISKPSPIQIQTIPVAMTGKSTLSSHCFSGTFTNECALKDAVETPFWLTLFLFSKM